MNTTNNTSNQPTMMDKAKNMTGNREPTATEKLQGGAQNVSQTTKDTLHNATGQTRDPSMMEQDYSGGAHHAHHDKNHEGHHEGPHEGHHEGHHDPAHGSNATGTHDDAHDQEDGKPSMMDKAKGSLNKAKHDVTHLFKGDKK